MKKWTYHHIFALAVGLSSLLLAAVLCLRALEVHIWVGFAASYELVFILSCFLGLVVPVWLTVWLWHRTNARWKRCVIVTFLIVVLLAALAMQGFAYRYDHSFTEYAVYTSPDGKHTVVVMTASFTFTEFGTVYEKTSPITMQEIGGFQWKFGSDYAVSWEKDHVVIQTVEKKTYFCLLED